MQLKMAVFSKCSEHFCFLEKINSFPEIFWTFFEMAEGINFTVECESNTKISRNVQKLCFFIKRWGFREKILKSFVKMPKVANLPQVDWNSRITPKFGFWKDRWFIRERNLSFWKQLNLANLMSTATETVSQFDVECERNSEISQNFQKLAFLQEKMGFPKKTLKFSKMARGIKFAVESNWKSKISQNVQTFGTYKTITGFCEKSWIYFELKLAVFSKRSQNLGFFIKKDRFSEKLWTFLKKTKVSNFAVESDWKSKVSQNVQNSFCF